MTNTNPRTSSSAPHFKVAIIEDDEQLASILARQLSRYAFLPALVDCLGDIVAQVNGIKPHIILLDVNLPQFDGFYWCRRIRQVTTVPILFVSARGAGMDQVYALENGGDDYVVKPFELDVLLAKLRAHVRRVYGDYANQEDLTIQHLQWGQLTLDDRRLTMSVGEMTCALTKTECALLRQLMEAQGKVVSRDALLDTLWDDTEFVDDNTLTVNVTRLRRKLESLNCDDFVRTVRGVGYQLAPVQ